jgi:tetratricopeptide (TPR) repeat protein
MRKERRIAAPVFAACLLTGCGGHTEVVNTRENAYAAVVQADQAFQSRDYATAAERYDVAVNGGGVNPDVYASSSVKLAISHAMLKKFDDAIAVLDKIEQEGAPNLAEIYAARSFILKKQGKAAESRAALAKARRYNPRIQEFKG